jgi:hypothetical protein
VSTNLLAIAEAPAAHIVPRHPGTVVGDGYVLSQMGPSHGVVQAIRLDSGRLAAARDEVLAAARENGWTGVSWWTSELTRPVALGESLGLDRGETLTALTLTEQPPDGTEFTVRRVETLADFATAQNIDGAEYGLPPKSADEHAGSWERLRDTFMLWLAFEGDRPVGMARAAAANDALMLIGGTTVKDERGRGVYRSLVAARWHAAVEHGMPALVVAANAQSSPILQKLGFDSVGEIQTWDDRL